MLLMGDTSVRVSSCVVGLDIRQDSRVVSSA